MRKIISKSITINNSGIKEEVFIADTFIEKLMGYMFRKEPHRNAILFNSCNSIHTFFMKFSIDVLFVNENMEIIKKIENLKPRKIVLPVKSASMVIEGESGKFKNFEIGDKIY